MSKLFSLQEKYDLTTIDGGSNFVYSLDEGYKYCKNITQKHYENFPVGSILIPSKVRKHFYAIYAFSRLGDDIADESYDIKATERIELLERMSQLLDEDFRNFSKFNPIFIALNNTIDEYSIPKDTLRKLLIAFRMDVEFRQARTLDDLLLYCSYSANPVGELVLRLFNKYDDSTKYFSDCICTALQLVNFWQDLSRDIPEARYYIPLSFYEKYDLKEINLQNEKNSAKLKDCINELSTITLELFELGKPLTNKLDGRLKAEIVAVWLSGRRILDKVIHLQDSVSEQRPELKKIDFVIIILKTLKQLIC